MTMVALDNALNDRGIRRDFARSGVLGGAHQPVA